MRSRPPSPLVAPQRPAVLRRGVATILVARGDQLDAAPGQLLPQRVTVVAAPDDDAGGLLPRTTGVMPPSYADRLKRRLREPDPAGRDSVKVVSRRNTRAVDHHHPLRSLAPLGPRGTAFVASAADCQLVICSVTVFSPFQPRYLAEHRGASGVCSRGQGLLFLEGPERRDQNPKGGGVEAEARRVASAQGSSPARRAREKSGRQKRV